MAAPLGQKLLVAWLLAWLGLFALAQSNQTLLIVGPSGADFAEVSETLKEELGRDFITHYRRVENYTSFDRFEEHVRGIKPDLIVLMDNPAIGHYRTYQQKYANETMPPAIAVMALFIDNNIQGIKNISGIRYEVPAVASFTNLRNLITKPIRRVGVIYRSSVASFIERQNQLCKREQLTLVGYPLPDREDHFKRSLRKALQHLIMKEKVDALWVINDSALLSLDAVRDVWVPKLRRFRKPVIVGVRPLIEDWEVGNFAVLPDHQGLGKQISELVYDMTSQDWDPSINEVVDPSSAFSILKLKYAERYLGLIKEKVGQVDVVLRN